jgi:ABC-type nitrate/sulfonate/bicarbonate transport system ATPase subunit
MDQGATRPDGQSIRPVDESGPKPAVAIEVDGVGFAYPGNVVMLDTSFIVNEGEFVSIIGPSGCGKSTLLLILAGLIRPGRGEVRVFGKPVEGPGRERAMVFQSFALMPWKSALENVVMGMRYYSTGMSRRDMRALAMEYLEKVGLRGFENQLPGQLSGGMQQRAGLARAFAARAPILLMDEPFASIDAQNAEIMREELRELCQKERRTIVFVTHNLDEALFLADRVFLMRTRPGAIVETVSVNLAHPRGFEAAAQQDRLRYAEIRGKMWDHLRNEIVRERGFAPPQQPKDAQ